MRRWLRFVGLTAYAGAVFVVFVVAAYAAFSVFVRSGATSVPELAGLTDGEAAAMLADQGLRVKEREG